MKKLFYLCLLVLTFSCDSDDGDTTIDTSQIVGEWTLDTIDISRVTLDGVDMTELFLSEMDDEEMDDSFDELEESTFNFKNDNTVSITGGEGELLSYNINGSTLTISEMTFDIISLDSSKMVLEMDFMSMMDDAFDDMDDDSDDIFGDLGAMEIITEWHFSKN